MRCRMADDASSHRRTSIRSKVSPASILASQSSHWRREAVGASMARSMSDRGPEIPARPRPEQNDARDLRLRGEASDNRVQGGRHHDRGCTGLALSGVNADLVPVAPLR